MSYRSNEPYNDLPLLPPQVIIETVPVLRRCVRASRALAELKGAGNLIPDQSILINSIPLQEARLSSAIENIVTTQDALFKAAVQAEANVDAATREVLRYRTALRRGYETIQQRNIDVDLLIELCTTLRNHPATLRDQEPILIEDAAAGAAVYTPPRGRERIVGLLRNMEAFLPEHDGLDPLLKMAIAHYQFEAIHPFVDGNGRTGRILNLLVLLKTGLLDIPVLYLSRYIIQNKQAYYQRLRAVTERGDWEGWLLYMLTAVEETARWTTQRIEAIRSLMEETIERCRAEQVRGYSKELIELIFRQPYCKIAFVIDTGIAQRDTASLYLQELERVGVLTSEKEGREIIYRNPALLSVLGSQ